MNERKEQMPVKFTIDPHSQDVLIVDAHTNIRYNIKGTPFEFGDSCDGQKPTNLLTQKRSIFSITYLPYSASFAAPARITVSYRLNTSEQAYKFCRDHGLPSSSIYDTRKDIDILLEADVKGEGWFSVYHTFEIEENPVKRALELGAYLRHHKEFIKKNGFYILPLELSLTADEPRTSIEFMRRVPYTWPEELE